MNRENLHTILKWSGIVVAIVLLLAFVVFLIYLYKYVEKPDANPYMAIPQDNAVLLVAKDRQTLDVYQQYVGVFSDIFLDNFSKPIGNYLHLLDQEPQLSALLDNNKIFISFQNYENHLLRSILVCPIAKKSQQKFEKYWRNTTHSTTYKNIPIVQINKKSQPFYAFYNQGIFVLTDNNQTLRKVINEWGNTSAPNSILDRLHDDFTLLVNNKCFLPYYQRQQRTLCDDLEKSYWLNEADYVYGSLTIKDSALYLKNKVHLSTGKLFDLSSSNAIDISRVVDEQTINLFYIGQQFYTMFEPQMWDRKVDNLLFSTLAPKEILLFSDKVAGGSDRNYLLINVKDVEETYNFLLSATETMLVRDDFEVIDYDTFYFKNTMIGRVDLPNFVYQRWRVGKNMPRLKNYAFINNDMVLFSDTDSNLTAYIATLHNHKENKNYERTSDFFVKQPQLINFTQAKTNGNNMIKRYQLQKFDDTTCLFYMVLKKER